MGGHKSFNVRSGDLFYFDPDDLVLKNDARSKMPLKERFVLNIMKYGVIKPVIITKDGEKALVDDGTQRTRHAREANKRLREAGEQAVLVPCVYRRGGELTRLGVSISANEYSQESDPLIKAKILEQYLGFGGTEEGAAVDFGVDIATIRNWLKLNELDPSVKKAVLAGTISPTAATQFAALPREEQAQQLEQLAAAGGKMTVSRARKAARKEPAPPTRRLRARMDIELAMMHQTTLLKSMDGYTALEWVMCWKDIKELDTAGS